MWAQDPALWSPSPVPSEGMSVLSKVGFWEPSGTPRCGEVVTAGWGHSSRWPIRAALAVLHIGGTCNIVFEINSFNA